jgi:GNAT superfamily N-acetyltransferase
MQKVPPVGQHDNSMHNVLLAVIATCALFLIKATFMRYSSPECCCSTILLLHRPAPPPRFELEDNLLSDDELQLHRLGKHSSVVYCYELQLDAAMHRKGLGRRLMQMLELLVRCAAGWFHIAAVLVHAGCGRLAVVYAGCFMLRVT